MTEAKFEDLQIVEMDGRDAFTWRLFRANWGDQHPGHQHAIGHVTLLISGKLSVTYGHDGRTELYEAPASIHIDKDVEHLLTADCDNTSWLCTFIIPEGGDAKTLSLETS